MSTNPVGRDRPSELVAGFLAAAAIFVALASIVYRPLRLDPPAVLLALIAVGIGGRFERLAGWATATAGVCFVLGLTVAVVSSHPLW